MWYKDYLTSRYLHINIKGAKLSREVSVGCPQGGLLSTLLWNIAFDDLLKLIDKSKITIVGYADDLDDESIIISGENLRLLYAETNHALAKCQEWAETNGLDNSPEKTEYILCTNKQRKSYTIPTTGISLKGKQIDPVTSVKYLGLHIDHRLTWHDQLNAKLDAARKNLFSLQNFIGKTWGPSPKLVKYAYTSCIRPIISYSCYAFADRLTKGQITKLRSFQRKVLLRLGNFRQQTPGAALDGLTDTMPIDLFLLAEQAKAGYRIRPHLDEDWTRKRC